MKEPHKVYFRTEVWNALVSIAEKEGVTIDEVIGRLINDKYAWGIPEPPKPTTNNNMPKDIRGLIKKLIAETWLTKIKPSEYDTLIVLYCNECNYISVTGMGSIVPWLCKNNHRMTSLGTLNQFV
jgi:hypothetical protein